MHKILITLVSFLSVFVFLGTPYLLFNIFPLPSTANEFSDSLGIVNIIFTWFAFLALIVNISQQRKMISQANEQIEIQKNEIKHNNELISEQRKEDNIRSMEKDFFMLLENQEHLVNNIRIPGFKGTLSGKTAFLQLRNQLIEKSRDVIDYSELKTAHKIIGKWYGQFYEVHGNDLGHYFRMLFFILLHLNNMSIDDNRKNIFANILRSRISQEELILIFYNTISTFGTTKEDRKNDSELCAEPTTYELITKYNIFKNIRTDDLVNENDLIFYQELYEEQMIRKKMSLA